MPSSACYCCTKPVVRVGRRVQVHQHIRLQAAVFELPHFGALCWSFTTHTLLQKTTVADSDNTQDLSGLSKGSYSSFNTPSAELYPPPSAVSAVHL